MTIEAIRITLHQYINITPDDKLKAIYEFLAGGLEEVDDKGATLFL